MAYCTESQVRDSLGDIDSTDVSTADVEEAIEEASSLIDSYIGVKYNLPIASPVPKMLQRICRDITVCHLYDDIISSGITITDETKKTSRCNRAMITLEGIRDGKQWLIDENGNVVDEKSDSSSTPYSNTNNYSKPQFFDVDDDTDWKFPEQMITDISTDRS